MRCDRYWRTQLLETARDCSSLGSPLFLVLVCAVVGLVDLIVAARLVLGLACVEASGNALKFFLHRERPDRQAHGNILERLDAARFPSIHTARVAMVAGAGGAWAGWMLLWLAVTVAVAVSRIVLRKHYVGDVLAGCLLGLVAGALTR